MPPNPYYQKRPVLRSLEGLWTRFEGLLNRLSSSKVRIAKQGVNFNPLYYVDTLGILLLIVILLTGIYLTIVYRPGADTAYQSMIEISASWFGSLMRTAHRYASQGLVIVILLHTAKMLFADRIWGARWLAWVSGILLVFVMWAVGVMGYFLIWDQPAQWLAEYFTQFLKGPIQITFATPNRTEDAFQFFVIILLLHIFLSLVIIAGMVIHEMRLQRPRVLSPRWLLITGSLVLIGLSLIKPVVDVQPADVSRLVETTKVDMSYLGFLPLAQQLGVPLFWGGSLAVLVVFCALPWLLRGKHTGPALVRAEACVACDICVKECPYNAIDMVARNVEGHKYATVALVNPSLCTGCGLCIGDCPTNCIDLIEEMPSPRLITDLHQTVKEVQAAGESPVVVLTCQRHAALGTFPATLNAAQAAPISLGEWKLTPVVACSVPCTGMIQSKWVKGSLSNGARSVVALSCPSEDCSSREGPRWLAERLNRGATRAQVHEAVQWLEVAPGDQSAFSHVLDEVAAGDRRKPATGGAQKVRHGVAFVGGLSLLVVTLALAYLFEQPVAAQTTDLGQLRIAMIHTAQIKALSDTSAITADLPPGVSPEQVMGGERYPIQLRIEIDSALVDEWSYVPGGLNRDGAAYALETRWLKPGTYFVEVTMMDDGKNWRLVFSGPVEIQSDRVAIMTYDAGKDQFIGH